MDNKTVLKLWYKRDTVVYPTELQYLCSFYNLSKKSMYLQPKYFNKYELKLKRHLTHSTIGAHIKKPFPQGEYRCQHPP
jgi:hypothetical protein